MPRERLTLVRDLITEIWTLGDEELAEFLSLMEKGTVEAMSELEKRQSGDETKVELRLILVRED